MVSGFGALFVWSRTQLVTALAWASLSALAHADPPVPPPGSPPLPDAVACAVREMDQTLAAPPRRCGDTANPALDPVPHPYPSFSIPLNPEIFCAPFRPEAFCAQVRQAVRDATGSSNGFENRPDRQALRARNPEIVRTALRKANEFFHRLVHSPDLQARCCGTNTRCSEHFAATELHILTGLGDSDSTAYYDSGTNAVVISQSELVNAITEPAIEQVLMHESGHACQFSRHSAAERAAMRHGCSDAVANLSWQDLSAARDSRMGVCMHDNLEAGREDRHRRFGFATCMGEWGQESFADAIFAHLRTRPDHWAWTCNGTVDRLHGPLRSVLPCIFGPPHPRTQFCPRPSVESRGL